MARTSVAVVGGGIAGLGAARLLAAHFDVVVFESSSRLGGKIETGRFREKTFDLGPDSFITRNKAAIELCQQLGLASELLAPASSKAALYARGSLGPLPKGLVLGVPTDVSSMWRSGAVSRRGALRAASDLLGLRARLPSSLMSNAEAGTIDQTIEEVFAPRIGREATYALIDPLLGGINASDVGELALSAAAPLLANALGGRRSVMRALRPLVSSRPDVRGRASTPPPSTPPLFFGLELGLETLITRLVEELRSLDVELVCNAEVTAIDDDPLRGHPRIVVNGQPRDIAAVVLATPSYVTARLFRESDPELAGLLGETPYADVVTAALAWSRAARATAPLDKLSRLFDLDDRDRTKLPGAGVLVAREPGRLITAVTFTSTKWPRSAQGDEIVLRVSAGRHNDNRAAQLDDEELVAAICRELGEMLGITSDPIDVAIKRWPQSFPQYVSGHLARQTRISARLAAQHGSIALAGAGYGGIGIPACIESGERAATVLTSALGVPAEHR